VAAEVELGRLAQTLALVLAVPVALVYPAA
jgi:hypothetical protein